MYWPPLIIGGLTVDLAHLEPFALACAVDGRDNALVINVRFSNHCFTEAFVDGVHSAETIVMDHKTKRAFSQVRYACSRSLPAALARLPSGKVHQTAEQRNYVYATTIESDHGELYEIYFTLKKAGGELGDLNLFVESAYPVDVATARPKRPRAIRFKVLALKIFRNEAVRFAAR